MLDIKRLRAEKEKIETKLKTKDPSISLEKILKQDEEVREIKAHSEHLKAVRNERSKSVPEKKQKGEDVEKIKEEVRLLGEKITHLDQRLLSLEAELNQALAHLPNIPLDEIPVSLNKEDNVVLKTVGQKPLFAFPPKHHMDLNEKLHLLDFHATAKISGSGWPAYRGMGARLEWALLNYMIEIQLLNGFEFWLPPLLVRPPIMFGSGQMPKFEGQFYEVVDGEHLLFLIPTSEVVLNGLHFDEILPEEKLPLKYMAYTPCFRREAGAAGAQERGLIRVHQFNKVEMFCFAHPDESQKIFDEMVAIAEEILQGLQLHYRLTLLVTGDMSFTAAKTVDVEVWLPGQNRYMEVSSISNCTDYQARRSKIRYRSKAGKPEFLHTLNGSGLATSRLFVALLENNQNEDGSVHLPPVLAERLGTHLLNV
jgi:seryl-tRNA synthetase